jgi:vanadium chloroperoxidase
MPVLPKGVDLLDANIFPVMYWNHVGLQMNRLTHSLNGPHGGPTMSSRALGLLHLAMHDAFFAVLGSTPTTVDPGIPTYLPKGLLPELPPALPQTLTNANAALTGAAITVLDLLYGGPSGSISAVATNTMAVAMSKMMADYEPYIDTLGDAHNFGVDVAKVICNLLAVKPGDPGADAGRYEPKPGPFHFRDEPLHPVRRIPIDPNHPERGMKTLRIYHAPFYGETVTEFAVHDPDGHDVAPWPRDDYNDAAKEVIELGGAAQLSSTKRTPAQTVIGLYWAYDGANLIGTPPRLYNQILRVIAWKELGVPNKINLAQNSELVRLFALANVAMADAGKFCWKAKYDQQLWRPLSGIREHHTTKADPDVTYDDSLSDPFWLALGAPDTNSNRISFKPPFPAYPSGHATFGAACFQMARLFYKKKNKSKDKFNFGDNAADQIAFTFVSEELDGVSRQLADAHDPTLPIEDQPGDVRTRMEITYPSLWQAIFDNAFSRIYLGVHWRFDAAQASDIAKGEPDRDARKIDYKNVWTAPRPTGPYPIGGVPLGLGIANDIFANRMTAPAKVADKLLPPEPEMKKSVTTVI